MSVASANNSTKKSKKKKKEVEESPQESESSEEELDLTKELHPIGHFMNDRPEMINQMFSVIKGSKLKTMLPPILKDYDIEKLKLECLDQLLGMSEKRISCVLEGQILETSSESDVASNDSESSSVNSQQKKKRKPESESSEKPNKAMKVEPEEAAAPERGKTLLEILELEMRARAIRALLKQGNGAETAATTPVVDDEIVDLTKDDVYPTVIKIEPPSEQEQNFEAIVGKSVNAEKADKNAVSKELELRNKIYKKKIYRTRQQRLENDEVSKEAARSADPVPEIENVPVKVKEEPIVVDEPEEGEVSSEEDVVVKEEKPDPEILQPEEHPKPIEGERICEINQGEFISDSNVLLEVPAESEDVNLIDDEDAVETVVIDLDDDSLNNIPEEIDSNDATTWRERWLQRDHVQKMVNTSKLVGLVKKRLVQKKSSARMTESEAEVAAPAPEPAVVLEGNVSEYQQLKETEPVENPI